MIVKEKELSNIIKYNFNSKTVLVELEGILNGYINFVQATCRYSHKNGMLYISELFNNIRINLASQYKIIYDEINKILQINLDEGINIRLKIKRNDN